MADVSVMVIIDENEEERSEIFLVGRVSTKYFGALTI